MYSTRVCSLAVVLLLLPLISNGENILFLQTTPSRSHHIWNSQIFNRLYDNGHNLTILTFEREQSIPGKTFLFVPRFYAKILAQLVAEDGGDSDSDMGPIGNIINMYGFYEHASNVLMKEPAISQLLNYPPNFKFDLIIHDFTMGQFLLGFVDRFGNPPLVSVSAFNIPSYTTQLADIPIRFTTMPNYASSYDQQMKFSERCWNLLYWLLDYYYRQYRFMSNEDRRLHQLFGSNSTSVKLLEKRSSVILVNSDFSMDYQQALPPNVIPVGGLHISRSESVSGSVARFLDIPCKGVIVLSLGTNVQSEGLGKEINQAILNTFAELRAYNFIWKHGDPESLGPIPPNVLVEKWVPQRTILSHPRTKLLISHGGLLSLQEATWYGVPVVGIPFFADQLQNVDKLERTRVGAKLMLNELNETTLIQVVRKLLDDDSYHQNMIKRSKLFRRQLQPPLDRAIFWIEKVLENKGLSYLTSPAVVEMSFFRVYGIDLIAATVVIAVILHVLWRRLMLSIFVNKQT